MKKLIALLLAFVMLLSFAACGDEAAARKAIEADSVLAKSWVEI